MSDIEERAEIIAKSDGLQKLVHYQREIESIERVIGHLVERKTELQGKFKALSKEIVGGSL